MTEPARRARAVYRGYPHASARRAGQVTRLHIIRDSPVGAHWVRRPPPAPYAQTWCGQGANQHRNSQPVILDPLPAKPPDGLEWCPKCIGQLAEWYGLLNDVAAMLAAHDPEAPS